ncbi:glutamine cyclotransferase [Marivirga tractuosa]|uniref:Peptidase M28 n=1 Tax=Marivirga tractuosa (strain ATCC 23168 / DSM 4126 / NBRC 15989 / NCIMB 1408 / VKM B-1430 / H-43) TaxID=643867 RepID=E4TN44_MARTH|nr:M28 family peptidase [Marivirga tractuosa]ADR22458.1 peptidase M28 [Marivirga tractuosa DSM 4126]BDD16871.1 glutamine cyclotransferase [Marivirga tractuosa]
MKNIISSVFIALFLISCDTSKEKKEETLGESAEKDLQVPSFSGGNAYQYVQEQVNFGPRVPNTPPHAATEKYIVNQLESFGAKVQTQKFEADTYDGEIWNLTNIIASIQPEKKKRIILAAHWDTRKIADKDAERKDEPIDGANDGGSGVGVILEVINAIQKAENKPNVGVDVIFFDGEDNGEPYGLSTNDPSKTWWCLGSQHWSKNKHVPGYSAYYGILLDMVGGVNAQFHKEGYSMKYAPSIVEKVWNTADQIGFGRYFINNRVGPITDDHYFVNEFGKIPMIDIIAHEPTSGDFFPDFHHTHKDNMDIISQETLKAVGQTLLQVIYEE